MSEIFGALIATLIVLSLSVPLFLFSTFQKNEFYSYASKQYDLALEQASVKLSFIKINNSSNDSFIYNYGQEAVTITRIIYGNVTEKTDLRVPAGSIIRLSNVVGPATIPSQGIYVCIDGNYLEYLPTS